MEKYHHFLEKCCLLTLYMTITTTLSTFFFFNDNNDDVQTLSNISVIIDNDASWSLIFVTKEHINFNDTTVRANLKCKNIQEKNIKWWIIKVICSVSSSAMYFLYLSLWTACMYGLFVVFTDNFQIARSKV